jgi:D-inositol-3-phosphate glycosyltransferase
MKVGLIGDGLALTTGFAQVLRRVAAACVARGWEVFQIASLDVPPACDSRPYQAMGVRPYFPDGRDVVGYSVAREVLERERPDVLFLNADPGCVWNWQEFLASWGLGADVLPTVVYAPVEGAPVAPLYADAFRRATVAYTYTRWSSETLAREHGLPVPWVYHGVDRQVFRPLSRAERERVRAELGWSGRFVIAYVARNVARKGHDRLLKAVAYLIREHGMDDLLLYLHCQPFEQHLLGGWDLRQIAHWCGVTGHVQFAPGADEGRAAVRGVETVRLAERLAAADLYVSTSAVEGFGLPLVEAMACGVPVVVPADEGNQQEVVGEAAAALLPVHDWGTWFNGAQLAHVEPGVVAAVVRYLRERPDILRQAGHAGLVRARDFCWDAMARALVDAIQAVGDGTSRAAGRERGKRVHADQAGVA